MKLSDYKIEDLETMSYDEIAHIILKESGKKEKLMNLFKKVCKVLKLDFNLQTENIGDFFELLSTNKKFIMLDNGYWDLQVNHKTKIVVEDDTNEIDSELDSDFVEANEINEETNEENNLFYQENETDDTPEDDLADLVIINEDDEEEMGM